FFSYDKELSKNELARLANDNFTIDEKIHFIDTLEQHVCGIDTNLDSDTQLKFSAILSLAKTYLHYYFGDKDRARAEAKLLSDNTFLKEDYSWMFGELSVEGFPAYHYRIAQDFFSNGQMEKALAENTIAIENALSGTFGRIYTPHIFDLHHQRSRILTGLGRIEDAIYSELEAIETNKNCSYFYHALGNLYKQKGDLKNAEKAQLDAIDRDPNSSQPFFQLSIIYNQKGELKKAIQYAKDALSLNGENPNYYHHYGNLLAKHGDYKEAEQAQLKTIELNSDIPGAYFQLSTIYNQQGNLEKAISRAKEALALKENNPFFHRHLGNLLKKYGDIQGSELAYARADELSA
ncbi:MAG: tetratricopeptide repeat protein, partial [Desulfovibrionaceae bacterium]|nr:tetratricopeptide repeat protein [Desulfovibrionaceae bacterium]